MKYDRTTDKGDAYDPLIAATNFAQHTACGGGTFTGRVTLLGSSN